MSSITIQEKIDEYKEQLPDQLYRELCDLTMKENKKEEEKKLKEYDFYEVKYAYPKHYYDDENISNIDIRFKTKIVKLEQVYYERIVNNILEDGYSPSCVCVKIGDDGYESKKIIDYEHIQVYNSTSNCYESDENKTFHYQSHSKILSIKKA